MKKIIVKTKPKYDVLIGNGILGKSGEYLKEILSCQKLCIVAGDTVFGLYGEKLQTSLKEAGYDVSVFTFTGGEKSKTMATVSEMLEFMADKKLTRNDAIVALGGGLVGDLAGFAASCYMRGIRFVQIPTTLLAAVDSSVGGKTGVNLSHGKNLAGAFWQPSIVICDYSLFRSLPEEELLSGLAEVIKYGVIADEDLFDVVLSSDLCSLFENDLLEDIIGKCVAIKSEIVSEDERDEGSRQILNFGHTLGHAIEKCSKYEIPHGHAVAIGMLYITRIATQLGITQAGCIAQIEHILKKYKFTLSCGYSAEQLYEAALSDKKRQGDFITLILPERIGSCRLEYVDINLFKELIEKVVS